VNPKENKNVFFLKIRRAVDYFLKIVSSKTGKPTCRNKTLKILQLIVKYYEQS
jgi:hypothetical protein